MRALVRAGAQARAPRGADTVVADALDGESYAGAVPPSDTLVHLVGVPHPSPAKASEFERVDGPSVAAAVLAARRAAVRHFVYLSVAHPAPVMRAYIAVRRRGEELVRGSGLAATILRPWYVLGPGHRWPWLLQPFYALASRVPQLRPAAERLGLVTREQMISALVAAVERPASGWRIWGVPEIRRAAPPRLLG